MLETGWLAPSPSVSNKARRIQPPAGTVQPARVFTAADADAARAWAAGATDEPPPPLPQDSSESLAPWAYGMLQKISAPVMGGGAPDGGERAPPRAAA